jgi:hypothetical protein
MQCFCASKMVLKFIDAFSDIHSQLIFHLNKQCDVLSLNTFNFKHYYELLTILIFYQFAQSQ